MQPGHPTTTSYAVASRPIVYSGRLGWLMYRLRQFGTGKLLAALLVMIVLAVGGWWAMRDSFAAQSGRTVAAYLPTYINDSELAYVADNPDLTRPLDRLHIAFALPNEAGQVVAPVLSERYVALAKQLPERVELSMSVGGWSVDGSRQKMEANLRLALRDPEAFANSILAARNNLAQQLDRHPDDLGIGLDLEWPTVDEADDVVTLAARIKDTMRQAGSTAGLTMAVPSSYNQAGFDIRSLASSVDVFEVMTYDFSVPDGGGNRQAGYIAPQDKVMAEIDRIVATAGNASKVSVGIPSHGWLFNGALAVGQNYTASDDSHSQQVMLKNVPQPSIAADGQAVVRGAVTSLVTPAMARATLAKLYSKYPDLNGAFVWPLNGTTVESMRVLDETD